MKRNVLTLIIAALLAVVFIALLFFGQVRKSTAVVITTFGNVTRTIDTPGLYGKWPWPIQQSYTLDERIQNFEDDKFDQSLTADNYNLLTMVYVGWQITDATNFFPKFAYGSVPEAEKALKPLLRSAKNAVVGQHPLSDFVSTDQQQLKFAAIEQEILKIVQDQVNQKGWGLQIKFLGIKKLGFPESVTQEVFKRMTSERAVLSSAIQFEGEAEASKIKSLADSKSAEIVANANAEAIRIKAEGQKEAAKSFSVFQQDPDFANFLLNLDAMSSSLKDRATLIFDQHSEPFNLFQGLSTNLSNPPQK